MKETVTDNAKDWEVKLSPNGTLFIHHQIEIDRNDCKIEIDRNDCKIEIDRNDCKIEIDRRY